MNKDCSMEFRIDYENGVIIETIVPDDDIDLECRICLENDNLIKPCACNSGIHIECLKEWMLTENNQNPTECEICKQNYNINFLAIFPEQHYNFIQQDNTIRNNTIRNNTIRDNTIHDNALMIWSENELVNSNRLNIIINSERRIRRTAERKQQCVRNTVIVLSLGDFLFGVSYVILCEPTGPCRDSIGSGIIFISTSILLLLLYGCLTRR